MVSIKKECIEKIKRLANSSNKEAGGILLGCMDDSIDSAEISLVTFSVNISENPKTRLKMPVEIMRKARRIIDDRETNVENIVGFWHSHLGFGAKPSKYDIERMKPKTTIIWLIYDKEYDNIGYYSMPNSKLIELEPNVI